MSILKRLKKIYWRYQSIWKSHPAFSSADKWKLHSITKEVFTDKIIKLKPKNLNSPIRIRRSFTDKEVLLYVLIDKYHLPVLPITIPDNGVILDLGSNIGLTIAHYKTLYPNITIVGCEMNIENYKIAQYNIKNYNNVHLENAAVWINDYGVSYNSNSTNDSFSINNSEVNQIHKLNVPSITIHKLIEKYQLEQIDFLKMDIEGAEVDILEHSDLSWLNMVQALGIEFHSDEDNITKFQKKLENQGFKVWRDKRHWNSILAINQKESKN